MPAEPAAYGIADYHWHWYARTALFQPVARSAPVAFRRTSGRSATSRGGFGSLGRVTRRRLELAMRRRTIEPRANWVEQVQARDWCTRSPAIGRTGTRARTMNLPLEKSTVSRRRPPNCSGCASKQGSTSSTVIVLPSSAFQPAPSTPFVAPGTQSRRRFTDGSIWRYDGQDIKLLEYNADTPTALLEASVIQWDWLRGAISAEPTSSTRCTNG